MDSVCVENFQQQYSYQVRIKYEPFYLEYHLDQEIVSLPSRFNEQHLYEVASIVMFCDPAGNMFQVVVGVILDKVYFMQGWNAVGKFYGLYLGGWVKLIFARSDLFFIQLRNRVDYEVFYPLPLNPITTLIANHLANLCKKPDIFHVLEKNLTHTDVTSDFLHIPVDFCPIAFWRSGVTIVLIDDFGLTTTTTFVEFPNVSGFSGLTHGWHHFCATKGFFEGLRVQFAVACSNLNLMSVVVCSA